MSYIRKDVLGAHVTFLLWGQRHFGVVEMMGDKYMIKDASNNVYHLHECELTPLMTYLQTKLRVYQESMWVRPWHLWRRAIFQGNDEKARAFLEESLQDCSLSDISREILQTALSSFCM